jgi:hypothetical protein
MYTPLYLESGRENERRRWHGTVDRNEQDKI